MSRQQIIAQHVAERQLFRLRSIDFELLGITQDEPRTVYVSSEIMEAVSTLPFPDTEEGYRLGEFRAWLDGFIEGGEISVAEDPDEKPPDAMLARVHPVKAEFWSIRVNDENQKPVIRSLGAFSDINEFVALIWDWRDSIGERFNEEVELVRETWVLYFELEDPHKGDDLNDYLTTYRAV